MAPFAVAVALLSALLTFVVLTGLTRIQPTREVVISFMLINAGVILLLVGIIVREVWTVVQARRRGRAAAKLHVQIVGLFSVIAVLPAAGGRFDLSLVPWRSLLTAVVAIGAAVLIAIGIASQIPQARRFVANRVRPALTDVHAVVRSPAKVTLLLSRGILPES